jgi:hypothetical protein
MSVKATRTPGRRTAESTSTTKSRSRSSLENKKLLKLAAPEKRSPRYKAIVNGPAQTEPRKASAHSQGYVRAMKALKEVRTKNEELSERISRLLTNLA